MTRRMICFLSCLLIASLAWSQTAKSLPAPDLAKQPTLYVVAYAHLDTEWRWDYVTTIREYLTKTMRLNFDWFEKYPHYTFNFSGANRYRMMKEYYPSDYERLKKYVAAGRWYPAGSAMEENDVNSPSAESIIRQVLYGKQYFMREFGKTSAEYMLPDCFGFPASLPSILAHCGIKGFSTQKLNANWQPAPFVGGPASPEQTPEGIPFNVGIWEGTDGKYVIAALNPGDYTGQVPYDLSQTPAPPPADATQRDRARIDWPARINLNGKVTGVFADYMYYGTGDTGGSANESSIKLMEAIVTKGTAAPAGDPSAPPSPPVQVGAGPVRVISARSDQMFQDLNPGQLSRLPRYKGDLELINHSAGSLTSQAAMKHWNRENEVLADAAEKAAVAADALGARPYPLQRLNDAWTLVMGGQFHDIIPGTSIPKAYEYAWNDEAIAMNQFASVLQSSAEAVVALMNTQTQGIPVVIYNSLNVEREDPVETRIAFPGGTPKFVRAFGPDGKEVPAQLTSSGSVLFLAKVPPVGYAVYDLRAADGAASSVLKVTESTLENERYRVTLDSNGDVSGIMDKALNRELLSGPIRLAISTDNPRNWPAWNMDFDQEQAAPRAYVTGPVQRRIVERGPARVAVEISRETEGSRFSQTIRLASGDAGNRIEFGHGMDWATKQANLKVAFPLSASNQNATYNWEIGTIERPTAQERQFEVASHQYVDLTDRGGAFGVTILTDTRNASDKPDDKTLRLTLVRTPGTRGGYPDQGTQDIGHHEFQYGIAGHAGNFRQAQTDWQAFRLNQPLFAFEAAKHAGSLGKAFSLAKVSESRIRVLALKKAEQGSGEVVIRLVELDGKPAQNVRVQFALPLVSAREVNGAEEPVGPASVSSGELVTSFTAFQPRTFAVKLGAPSVRAAAILSVPIKLPLDQCVTTPDGRPGAGAFDGQGRAIPAEMLPAEITFAGAKFTLAVAGAKYNAVTARGQSIALPAGQHTRMYLLAGADGDQKGVFQIGDKPFELVVQNWTGYIGQWDNRIWKATEIQERARPGVPAIPRQPRMDPYGEMTGLIPGFMKQAPVAWFASHRHGPDGANDPYAYSYLFAYMLELPAGARSVTLPVNERVRILAITVTDEGQQIRLARPLFDWLNR
jgi:alpha-mannosidase